MYFQVDSVDKVDTGNSVRKQTLANYCNTIYYLFFNQKTKLYMYRVLSTFGYEFQVFPESVNACQRLSTHDFSWMCLI